MRKQFTWAMLGAVISLPLVAVGQEPPTVTTEPEPSPALPADDASTVEASAPVVPGPESALRPAASEAVTDVGVGAEPTQTIAETPATTESSAASGRNRMIEEVVVTAQKREERIQDVPIAITAFSSEKLEALGIATAQDLERVTPGLTITNAAGFNVAYLRGVGTDAFLPGADSSVPFYLDGVPLLGAQGSSDTLGRVERVEVLKGPQGTLFGRNSTGGAISIITPDPSDTFTGDVSGELGNYESRKGLAYVNVPITSRIAASISAFDGAQRNFTVNDTGPIIGVYSGGGRVKLRWNVTDDLKITLAGSYQESSNNGGLNFENTRVAPDFALILPQDPSANRHVSFDSLSGARTRSHLFSETINYHLDSIDIKFLASEQGLEAPFVQSDFDKSDLPIVNIDSIHQNSVQHTAELQFLSNDETPFHKYFKFVGGFFYLDSAGGFNPIAFDVAPNALTALSTAAGGSAAAAAELNQLSGLLNSSLLSPLNSLTNLNLNLDDGVRVLSSGVLRSKAYSAYFQGTTSFTDQIDLTTGVRFQHEERDLVDSSTGVQNESSGETSLISENVPTLYSNQLSPRVALQYRPFENTQIYTSWARGFKSPTYNTVNLLGGLPTTIGCAKDATPSVCAPDIEPLKAERVDSFELGTKTELFDRNLRLNAAAFLTYQKNLLTGFVALLSGGVVSYENAPAAKIIGQEADFLYIPLPTFDEGLVVTGAISHIHARYTDYPDGKGFDTTTGLAFGSGGTEALPARNFDGNHIVRTPTLTTSLGLSQTIPVHDGSFELGGDVNYNSGFYFLPQNSDLYARQANTLVNLRATYIYDPWSMQIGAFINNVTQTVYNEVVFVDDFGRNQVLNAPRTFGLRAKYTF